MKKRIISLMLTLVILACSVVSASAAIDTAGLTEISTSLDTIYFTGDTDSLKGGIFTADGISVSIDSDGNKTTSNVKGGDRYIKSKIVYDLGEKFEIRFDTNSDNQNPNSNNRIVYQFGQLAIAYFSYGSGTNNNHGVFRLYYGADIASIGGSGIAYDSTSNVIAESGDVQIGTRKVVVGFDNGTVDFAVYSSGDELLYETTVTIDSYDFSAVAPAIRAYKRSATWANGLYTSGLSIKAELNGAVLSDRIAAYSPAELTYDDIAAVKVLRQWYDSLDETAQADVTNYATLEALEARVPVLEAENFNAIIGSIVVDELKLGNKSEIEGYRAQYDAMTDEQKALVTNIDNLVAAEAEILRLVILKNDTDAANVVNDEILAMGEIDYSNFLCVSDARASFETLTEQGKSLVADYNVLTTAEATVKSLRKATSFRMVNELIAAIPETVTMSDNDAVFNALGAYSMLSTAEKRLVTDINAVIDKANTLVQAEVANNTLISPKIVSLVQIGKTHGSGYSAGVLPDKETGLYFGLEDGVEIYKGDTVKPGVYWSNLFYNVVYDDDGNVSSYSNTGTVYNVTTGGSNWWGNNFQPLSNGAIRNASVGVLNFYHSNVGIQISTCEVKERPTYEYNELFDVAMNVRTMIAALPKEYSKLTEADRYLVDSTNEALDSLSVFDLDEVHEVRYLINCEKVLNGAVLEDEENTTESNITGDITKDFKINSLDLLSLQMHILNINMVIDADRCDVNNDGVVDSSDLVALQMYIVGLATL